MLKKNLNKTGRLVRFIAAVVLFVLSLVFKNFILLLVGAFVLFEALFSWCIVYHFLGINQCKMKK